jgi:hypothetical protein
MRKKMRKSLAFLLALALVVSVMSGLGLSVSAEEDAANMPTSSESAEEESQAEVTKETEENNEEEKTEEGTEGETPAEPTQEETTEEETKKEETQEDSQEANGGEKEAAEDSEEETEAEQANINLADVAGSGITGGNTVADQSLTHEKYVTLNSDGTYDLSLTVCGAKGTETNPAKVDVLMILDRSNSMNDSLGTQTRLQAVQTAATTLITNLTSNTKIDVQYSIVSFAPTANVECDWTANATTAKNAVNGISINESGTNYQSGIFKAKQQLNANGKRSNAQTIVIFLTDGEPTAMGTTSKTTVNGNGGRTCYQAYIDAAKNELTGMTADGFYCVGVALSTKINVYSTGSQSQKTGAAILQEVIAGATNIKNAPAPMLASDTTTLNKVFEDIEAKITEFLCSNVTVTDVLSENVEVVLGVDNEPKKLTVTVKDKNGNVVTTPEGITASYNKNTKTITMDFPDAYELNPDYTYIVTATIDATEKAYENYRANGNAYPNTGAAGTGATSAGKLGVYSNEAGKATVTYTYKGTTKSEEYPMPVIQLHPGTLTITKTIAGDLTDEEKSALVEKMTVDVTLNETEEKLSLSAFTKNGETYTYQYKGLSPNTTYSVTESNAKVENYDLATTSLPVVGTVGKDDAKSVEITNTYTKSTQNLTIEKQVSGSDDAYALNVDDITYTFTVTANEGAKVDGEYTINNSQSTVTFKNGTATVTVKGTGSITIKELPVGKYTVTETARSSDPTGYDFDSSTVTTGTATLTAENAGQVTITNKYNIKKLKVTVVKEVTGNMGDTNKDFTFSYDEATFTLKDKGQKEFEVKYGTKFSVTENDYTEDGYATSYQVNSLTAKSGNTCAIDQVTTDTTITFTNDKTIQPPNGIITTIAPYAIMVVLAAGAAVYFVYSRRRHNG